MQIEYNNIIYEILIIRKQNKNIYIRVNNNRQVIITCNHFTPNYQIKNIIKDNYKSIIKMISKQEDKLAKEKNFYLFGKPYNIIYDDKINIYKEEDTIYVKDEKYLNKWLSNYIYSTFSNHLKYWQDIYEEKIPIPNLKIRKMKTRWGVCNTKNHNITLNSELYKYDIECLDYVIVHELSHFIEANHSTNFWLQVSKYCPNYKEIRKKLKD